MTPVTNIAEAVYNVNEGENIYIAGSSSGTSLTANSNTLNIFLHKVKTVDGSTVFTTYWGLDGVS